MPSRGKPTLLARAAARVEGDRFFLASALAAYREFAEISEAELAKWLGVLPVGMPRLALCRRPEEDDPMFRKDVERIAEFSGADAGRLANLLRTVGNAEAMGTGSLTSLLAARDREPEARDEAEKPRASEQPEQPQ